MGEASADQLRRHYYSLGLQVSETSNVAPFPVEGTFNMAEYCGRRWLHLLPAALLQRVLTELGVSTQGLRNQLGLASALLDSFEVEDRETMVKLIEVEARRRKRKADAPEQGEDD